MERPWTLTIDELAKLYRSGQTDPVQIIEAFRARIAKVDPALNCFVALNPDLEADAAQSAERWKAGAPLSPLDGVPLAIKDNLVVAGMPATWGSAAFAGHVCTEDELPIARLRAAGALFQGKTNTPEFAVEGYTHNALFGTTRNALNPDLTPGGSSGGSASAVAAGMTMTAIGTDGGGSIRRPAGYAGLYGLKPTIGSIPRHGGLPQVLLDFEVVGGLTRCVGDLRLLHETMSGPAPCDPASRTCPKRAATDRPLRILHVPLLDGQPCDPDICAASERAARMMADLGHEVISSEMPFDLMALNDIWPRIGRIGLARMFDAEPQLEAKAAASYRDMAREGREFSAPQLLEVLDIVRQLRSRLGEFFTAFDVIMMPCAAARPWSASVPFPDRIDGQIVGPRGHAIYTGWVNAAGLPALAIPVDPPVEGIPIGIQLVADLGQEDLLMQLGETYECSAVS